MTEPQTKIDAYQHVRDSGEDVSLRKLVAAELARESLTTHELAKRLDHSKNAVRPRVNELIRMDCVRREGTRENPSGHDAAVHHLTPTGERYLRGEVDPEPDPPLAQAKRNVVDAARDYLAGKIDESVLGGVVEYHDRLERKLDPEE